MNFESLYKEFAPRIYRLCLGYTNDEELAKDLMQESLITIWEKLDTFRGESAIGTWIYRIVSNKCLRHMEVQQRHKRMNIQFVEEHSYELEDQNLKFLRNCISELKEVDRLIIGLYLEEVHQEIIADIVGISHSNMRVRLHRIKKELSRKFQHNGRV